MCVGTGARTTHLEISVEHHDFLSGNEEVHFGRRLTLAIRSLKKHFFTIFKIVTPKTFFRNFWNIYAKNIFSQFLKYLRRKHFFTIFEIFTPKTFFTMGHDFLNIYAENIFHNGSRFFKYLRRKHFSQWVTESGTGVAIF
jgi:hypothetical protein